LEEPTLEIGSSIARTRDGIVDSRTGAPSSIHRIFGRQALSDLLKKFKREQERESFCFKFYASAPNSGELFRLC
ncbi:hypothetical protein Tco_0388437, partial [Tanacetum coccineum]